MGKKIFISIALLLIAIDSVSAYSGVVNINFPLDTSIIPNKEINNFYYYKVINSMNNNKELDKGFILLMPDWHYSEDCFLKNDFVNIKKQDCNKINVWWSGIGNPKTSEFSETTITMDLDLKKEMTNIEIFNYIFTLSNNKQAILENAYIMKTKDNKEMDELEKILNEL